MSEKPVSTICSYCSIGCALEVSRKDGGGYLIQGQPDYPVNLGKACDKGLNLIEPLLSGSRGTQPLLKTESGLKPVDWDEAVEVFSSRMKAIISEWGPESVAFLSTGQITTEEMALLGAVAKFGMGMVHGDGNTRQCMASASVAYKQAFGFDAPPYACSDLEESDVIVFFGANPVVAHPLLWSRIRSNCSQPTVIVVDPRKTKSAQAATHHYALEPKTDLLLLYAISNVLIERGWIDHEFIEQHTQGFPVYRAHVAEYPVKYAASRCGLSEEQIEEFARLIHEGRCVSFWWSMGVNQSHQGVKTSEAIINLALMTGNIGRPGTGANSITGQCNAMGSRLFANTTNLFGGHDFEDCGHRRKIAAILNINDSRIPDQPSLPYHKILERVRKGEIKGLWIVGTNPAHTWVDLNGFEEAAEALDFLVVQDIYPDTATARLADLYLPAAASSEKEGSFINSERRIGHVQKVCDPPGEALPDFDIFLRIARAWNCGSWIENWKDPESVFRLLQKVSAGQPCDITGIQGYEHLDEAGGIQWPFPAGGTLTKNQRRLFGDLQFFHKDGKARFGFTELAESAEQCSPDYPFWLITGRGSITQWHTLSRTDKVEKLRRMSPEKLYVEINPQDAAELGIGQGDTVWVCSARGEIPAVAALEESMARHHVFLPMHYESTNRLTLPSFDPESFQPTYKSGAVVLEKR